MKTPFPFYAAWQWWMLRQLPILASVVLLGCGDAFPPDNGVKAITMDPRERLLQRIGEINDFSRPRPLVTIEEFFEGNDDPGSIGYNLSPPVGPQQFYSLLKTLRDRHDVADIRIAVKQLEYPDGWPSTDTIWFITSASAATVRSWLSDPIVPDDIFDGFGAVGESIEPYDIPDGMNAVGAWYD